MTKPIKKRDLRHTPLRYTIAQIKAMIAPLPSVVTVTPEKDGTITISKGCTGQRIKRP